MNNKIIWFNDNLQYVINQNIMEYDMKAASVSVCEYFNLLDQETLKKMKLMTKENRTKQMGLIQRNNKEFSEKLFTGIRTVRGQFLEQNNLTEDNVLSLHSDAVIFNSKKRVKCDVDGIKFVNKNTWTSYIRYNKIEIFYNKGCIEYKGITDLNRQQHTLGFHQYLLKIFDKLENQDPTILRYISNFQQQYLQDKLPEYYYHSFGLIGPYKLENLNLLSYMTQLILNEMKGW